jgi:hypothetical protein
MIWKGIANCLIQKVNTLEYIRIFYSEAVILQTTSSTRTTCVTYFKI